MATIRPEVTGCTIGQQIEPLAVSPRQACRLLTVGNTRLYELIAAGEIESYRDGRSRRISMESIRRRVARLLAAAGANAAAMEVTPLRSRRGRRPKGRTEGSAAP